MRPSESIIDQLTDNFDIKTLKANRNNVKKLSGMFAKGMISTNTQDHENVVDFKSTSSSSSSSSVLASSSENGHSPDVHGTQLTSSVSMSNNNGNVNAVHLDTKTNMDTDQLGMLHRDEQFRFEKMDPSGTIEFGNMQHPLYFTPFGLFKPSKP